MKKIISGILMVVLAVVVLVAAGKDTIVRISIEKGVEAVTGVQLKMGSLKIGIMNTLVGIKDLKLYNPSGYENKIMADMPEIFMDYDLPSILKGDIHLYEARINLKELMVVKNAKGELNLNALTSVKQGGEKTKADSTTGKAAEFHIDKLRLTVGKVIYKDYSRGGKPSVQEFNINIDEEFRNIDDPTKLANVILVRALMNTTIARLANFNLQALQNSVGDTLATAQKLIGTAGNTLLKTTEGATGAVTSTTTDTVKKTTEGLVQAIKLPFGSKKQ